MEKEYVVINEQRYQVGKLYWSDELDNIVWLVGMKADTLCVSNNKNTPIEQCMLINEIKDYNHCRDHFGQIRSEATDKIYISTDEGVLTGGFDGLSYRKKLKINQYDQTPTNYAIEIDPEIKYISTSFLIGLFEESILEYGSLEKFYKKYQFNFNASPPGLRETIKTIAMRVL